MTIDEARRQLATLQQNLYNLSSRDPDQEVRGIAVPVLATIIDEVKNAIGPSPLVASIGDVITEQIISGDAVRAADALHVVSALLEALPEA